VSANAVREGLTTRDALAAALPLLARHAVVCANGHISRWACALGDKPDQFYMIGSMGLASSIGLGIALAASERPVAVIDGDGNLLMNLGTLAMVGALAPQRFLHLVLDNGVYASTGNQPSVSRRVALDEIARAAGYRLTARVRDRLALADSLARLVAESGPTLLLVETLPDRGDPAPRIPLAPPELTARMRAALATAVPGARAERA
jgi:sulfopyruvate decarboxylase subunit beta